MRSVSSCCRSVSTVLLQPWGCLTVSSSAAQCLPFVISLFLHLSPDGRAALGLPSPSTPLPYSAPPAYTHAAHPFAHKHAPLCAQLQSKYDTAQHANGVLDTQLRAAEQRILALEAEAAHMSSIRAGIAAEAGAAKRAMEDADLLIGQLRREVDVRRSLASRVG